jgi:hypothetical protein
MFGVYTPLLLVELMSVVLFLVYINLPIPQGLDVPTDSTCMLAFLNESPRQYVEIELLIEQAVQFQIHSSVIFVVRNVIFHHHHYENIENNCFPKESASNLRCHQCDVISVMSSV